MNFEVLSFISGTLAGENKSLMNETLFTHLKILFLFFDML